VDRNAPSDAPAALTVAEALAVVEPCYVATQDIFLAYGLSLLGTTRIRCSQWVHDKPRHFAACETSGRYIVVAPEIVELPTDTVFAILAHELGHAADFLYPARFVLNERHPDGVEDRGAPEDTKQWRKWLNGWKKRNDDDVEFTADAIGSAVLGAPIGYCGPCNLQCFSGVPRPEGLR
jgi:hypothetical protein